MPQAQLPDGTILDFPEGTDPTIMDQAVKNHLAPSTDIGYGEEFTRGVQRGAENALSLVTEGVPALTKSLLNKAQEGLGFDPSFEPEKNLEQYQKEVAETFKKFPTEYGSVKDVDDVQGAMHFAASAAGEVLPSIASSLFGGGIGAITAREGLKQLAKRGGKELLDKEINKAMIKGTLLGSTAIGAPQNISETYLNLLEGGEDAPMTALAVGGMKTALDNITPTTILGKVFGTKAATDVVAKNLLKRIGIEGVRAGAFEGLTEASQEALDIFAEQSLGLGPDLVSSDTAYRLMDAGLKGTIGGGLVGGVTAPMITPTEDLETYKPSEESKTLMETEDVTDSTIVKPAYVDDSTLTTAEDMGLDVETISEVSSNDVEGVTATIDNLSAPTTKTPLRATPVQMNPVVLETTKQRQQDIKSGQEKDFGAFVLGDGMIHVGAETYPTTIIVKPASKIKVKDSTKLSKKARRKTKVKPPVTPTPNFPEFIPEGSGAFSRKVKPTPLGKEGDFVYREIETSTSALSELLGGRTAVFVASDPSIALGQGKAAGGLQVKLRADFISGKKQDIKPGIKALGVSEYKTNFITNDAIEEVISPKGSITSGKSGYRILDENFYAPKIQKDGSAIYKPLPLAERGIPSELRKTKLQKGMNLPFHGNLQQDYVMPMKIAEDLQALKLTPEAKKQLKPLMDLASRNIKEIAGPAANVEFFSDIREGGEDFFTSNPVKGAQFMHTIALTLDQLTTPLSINETSYHEAIHFLWDTSFSKGEKQILLKNTEQLRAYALKDDYLKGVDFDNLLLTPIGKEELITNALAKMMVEYKQDINNLDNLPSAYRRAFLKVKNFLQRLSNGLRGLGFTSFDDIFHSIEEGQRARDSLDEAIATNATARYQRMADAFNDVHNDEKNKSFAEIVSDARHQSNLKSQETGKGMSIYGRYVRSIIDLASKNPFAGVVYDSVRRRLDNSAKLLNGYMEDQQDFGTLPKDTRYRIQELADEMRSSKQKATLDDEGNLIFKRGDRTLRLKDKEVSANYMNLQKSYRSVLNGWQDELARSGAKTFKDYLPVQETYTKADFTAALDLVDETTAPERHSQLTNLIEALQAVDNFKAYDFSPRMRFGSSGIAVKDMEGETVAFYTVEGGSFRDLYNKYQIEDAVTQIKEKYSDATEYSVHDANGKVKSLNANTLTPFTMTHNKIKNNINMRFMNIEALSSLLFSKNMDTQAYEEMRKSVYDDILQRGFEKRFSESKNVEGYSRDWDRVHHGYLSGAAHFLSGLPHQEELSVLGIEAEKLADPVLREKIIGKSGKGGYLNYVNSPQEDWQMTRTINFMWTMGGNVSTALLQTVTLPTTTLGVMNQYNPNMIQNMKSIGKWTKLGGMFIKETMKTISLKDGHTDIQFNDPIILDRLEKQGKITKAERAFIGKVDLYGKWKTTLVRESVETRSPVGGLRGQLSHVGELLGMPTSIMEQMTRFATTMASFEMLNNNKHARDRMDKVLGKDYRFQAQVRNQTDMSLAENGALFNMDEAHAVFGKVGRVEYQRSIGGALFFPFMTYPHQQLELLARMLGRGAEGKRGFATTITALALLGGLIGLPGAELLKELMEALQQQITGVEEDYDLLAREKIYDLTGSTSFAKAVTQGIGRGYLGIDIAKRIGLPIPGQELLLSFTGIKSQPAAMLGVQGSIITGIGHAWNEYNQGAGASSLLKAVVPVAASNLVKAYEYTEKGAMTGAGLQIVRPEDMKVQSVMARALGITSDQIATGREKLYYSRLTQQKYRTGLDRFRKQAQTAVTSMYRSQNEGDSNSAKEYLQDYKDIMNNLKDFALKHKIPVNFSAFNRSVMTGARQRLTEGVDYKTIRKGSRLAVKDLLEAIGAK